MGQLVKLIIDDMSDRGQGIGRTEEGMAVFVMGAIPGDHVTAELTKVKKRYAFGKLVHIDRPSEDRREGFCIYNGECGGCPYSAMNYEAQLSLKERHVRDALERLGGVEDPAVRPALAAAESCAYRNKAVMPVSTGGIVPKKGGVIIPAGEPRVGFYRARSHNVVDCSTCRLQAAPAMAAAEALRAFMKEDHITGYDSRWDKGLFRHMTVRTAFGTGEVMVILVINGKGIPNGDKLCMMLDDAIADCEYDENGEPRYVLSSVVININKGKTDRIYGDKSYVLAGSPVIHEEIGGMKYEISPMSFYQVNPRQMEALYNKAAEYADLKGGETVLDLYCGAGTIGLWLIHELAERDPEAAGSVRMLGIESVREAVLDANRNAVLNHIVNARYICGKAEDMLEQMMDPESDLEEGLRITSADVAVLDPPRAGCEEKMLDAVAKAQPERIVYVSCNPATLARDVKYLAGRDWKLEEVTPVDMFPWTGRAEAVCLLRRIK